MTTEELRMIWEKEESIAHIKGWDFSHIHGRYEEENSLPWDYKTIIHDLLRNDMKLLDYDTGGGEFLLSLRHPYENTAASVQMLLTYPSMTILLISSSTGMVTFIRRRSEGC